MKYSVTIALEYDSPFSLFPANQWETALRKAAETGFQGAELCISDYRKVNPFFLKEKMKEYQLLCPTISTGQAYSKENVSLLDTGMKKNKCIERFFRHIEVAKELNSKVTIGILKGNATKENRDEAEKRLADNLQKIVEYAENQRVTLVLEAMNRFESSLLNTVKDVKNFIQNYFSDTENLEILWDSFHANIEEMKMGRSILQAGPLLGHVHLADSNRLRPGLGHISFEEIFLSLSEIGYDGFVSYECVPEKEADNWWSYLQEFQKNIENINK